MTKSYPVQIMALIVSLSTILLCPEMSWAKKPGPDAGGGGTGGGVSYTIVRLDDAGGAFVGGPANTANDINEYGNVVGTVVDAASGNYVPAFWGVSGTVSQIVPLGGGTFANGLNNFNEIAGYGDGDALYWPSPADAPVALTPLHTGYRCVAQRINDAGVICGYAVQPVLDDNGDEIGLSFVAVVWRVDWIDGDLEIAGPVPLPTIDAQSQAFDLNENDNNGYANVVGRFMTSNWINTAAVEWTVQSHADGGISVSPTPVALEMGDAVAYGNNNLGISCGDSADGPELHAKLWAGGSVLTLDPDQRTDTSALDINDAGVIVGEGGPHSLWLEALVWPSPTARPVALSRFLPKRRAPFVGLWNATAINEAGVITGEGGDGSTTFAFVAIPN